MRDRKLVKIDEEEAYSKIRKESAKLWKKING